jgi:hypothetical protein
MRISDFHVIKEPKVPSIREYSILEEVHRKKVDPKKKKYF